MKVVIKQDGNDLKIYEFLEEKEKTYRVKPTYTVELRNRGWGVVVKKFECAYVGEFTDEVKGLVNNWNDEKDKMLLEISHIEAVFTLNTAFLKNKLFDKSEEKQ